MAKVVIKEVDRQGRVVIPKEWRERYLRGRRVLMRVKEGLIELLPADAPSLAEHFDSVDADVGADLADWHAVRRELRALGEVRRR